MHTAVIIITGIIKPENYFYKCSPTPEIKSENMNTNNKYT